MVGHRHQSIKVDAAGIVISASDICPVPEHYGTVPGPLIPLPDCFRHRRSFYSGTRLTGCGTVRHSGIFKNCTKEERGTPYTSTLLKWRGIHPSCPYTAFHGVKLASWCWTFICKCRNTEKHLVRQSAALVRHRYSGIRVSPVRTAGHGLARHCPAMLVALKISHGLMSIIIKGYYSCH